MSTNQEALESLVAIRGSVEKMQDRQANELGNLRDRVEDLEARRGTPGRASAGTSVTGANGITYSAAEREHTRVFCDWIRASRDPRRTKALIECESDLERKDVTTTTSAAGGYGVPLEISNDIERRVSQLNPFRGLVDVVPVGTANFRALVDMRRRDDRLGGRNRHA